MSPRTWEYWTLTIPAALLVACDSGAIEPSAESSGPFPISAVPGQAPEKPGQFATLIALPFLSGHSGEALAVNNAGTVVGGYSWERGMQSVMRAVKWTLQNDGSWAISVLPHAPTATGASARAVNDAGDVAGNDWPGSTPHAMLWPAGGGHTVLGCNDLGLGYAISANGQTVVGSASYVGLGPAAVWRPGSCREDLPQLFAGGGAGAFAVDGAGTLVGGGAADATGPAYPVRWTGGAGNWQVEQLGTTPGLVLGGNAAGDFAGFARIACSMADGCSRAMIWYAAGGTRQLGTLGGVHSVAEDINADGEVVGVSTNSGGVNTAFFWSQSDGMVQLPVKTRAAFPNAISDPRADGSRVVGGMSSRGLPIAWIIH